jgi:hypothetical protein
MVFGFNHGVLHCSLESVMQVHPFLVIACAVNECLLHGNMRILSYPPKTCVVFQVFRDIGVLGFLLL